MTTNHEHTDKDSPLCQVAIVGECMIELTGQPPHLKQSFAGDTLNTAVYLSRLTRGGNCQVSYVTAVGTDGFSRAMLQNWREEGIHCQWVTQIPDRHPGIYFIEVDSNGERSFSYWRNESAAKMCFEVPQGEAILAALEQVDWLYLSGISLAILPQSSRARLLDSIRTLRARGGKVAFDNNYRPRLWASRNEACTVYDQFMAECDLALLTLDDEQALRANSSVDSVLARCKDLNIPETVIKCGASPCQIQSPMGRSSVAAKFIAQVVDTTAAGDSFSAGYLAARIQGLSPDESAAWGHSLAGQVIQHPGAIIAKEWMPQLSVTATAESQSY